jgi:hypothetical protein
VKCIHCGKDNNHDTRKKTGGCCEGCGHRFAFEPQTDKPKVTDRLFEQAIEDVGGNGRLGFTERQLWYSLDRRLSRWKWGGWIAAAVFVGFPVGAIGRSLVAGVAVALAILLFGALVYLGRRSRILRRGPSIDFTTFRGFLHRWSEAHGEPTRLLHLPRNPWGTLMASPDPPIDRPGREPDLTAYSFDRAVVADRAETAAMLVANNFHFEHNCAVLSADGYPAGRAETIMEMLRRNPALQVFAVHDASARGCELPFVLRRKEWFPDPGISILDVGLRPSHARRLRLPVLHTNEYHLLSPELASHLGPKEATWLTTGNVVELAALPPRRLMRAIFQGFSRPRQSEGDGGDGGFVWFYDADADVHATDSFG